MQKTIPFLLVILLVGVTTGAGAYTVILKNGKQMNGTLISETEQVILFKDEGGVQYSLKKANLDLARMTAANAAQPEVAPVTPAPSAAPVAKTESKKKSRVYTKEDVDALREKYPELSIGEPIENPEDFEGGVLKAESYGKRIHEAATRVNENISGLAKLRDAAATAWEVAASTGKDPAEAVNAALATEEATLILKETSNDLSTLGRWEESMANAPDQYKDGYQLFVQTIADLSDFQRAVREWNTFENVNLFRSRLSDLESRLNANTQRLQTWQPKGATGTPPAAAPPAETEPDPAEEDETEEEPPIE
jgi:hypothetical protein